MKNTDNLKLVSFFRGKLKFFQPKEHRISVDLLIFLSKIKPLKKNQKVIDLGAGFGFLSITLAKKYRVKVVAFEYDEKMVKILRENVKLNGLGELVKVVKGDVKEVDKYFPKDSFNVVVSNPPFYPVNYSPEPEPYHFEVNATLEDFVKASSYLLKDGGELYILVPCFRLYELSNYLRDFNLPLRRLSLIYPTIEKRAKLAVVVSVRNVSGPLECDKPLIINEKGGEYTKEVKELLESFL